MAQARQQEEFEPLVRLDQRVREPIRVRRVHVVVDVPGDEHQAALEVSRTYLQPASSANLFYQPRQIQFGLRLSY